MPFTPPFWSPSQASAILFDWDGVIAETSLDFSEIRSRYYGGKRAMLLEDACLLPEARRASLMRELKELEISGARRARPVKGAQDVLAWVKERKIPWAIVSRNCGESILIASERIGVELPPLVRSRDDGDCVKPDPRALTETARELGADPAQTLFVGDFIYDMMGARRAGMRGVLVREKIEPSWHEWLECSYPAMELLAEELRAPSELIPWEYLEIAGKMGRRFLSSAAALTLALPGLPTPSIDCWLARAASLGVGSFLIPKATFTPGLWKANPSFNPAYMGLPLIEAVQNFLRTRYPFATATPTDTQGKETAMDAPSCADDLACYLSSLFAQEARGLR